MASNKISALKKKDDDSILEESGASTKKGAGQEVADIEDASFDVE
jgi:hypothetical protein